MGRLTLARPVRTIVPESCREDNGHTVVALGVLSRAHDQRGGRREGLRLVLVDVELTREAYHIVS